MPCSLSTHVLDTAAGRPAPGVAVELLRDGASVTTAETDADGRARLADDLPPGTYRLVFHPPSPFFTPGRAAGRADGRPLPRPAPRLSVRMRELPGEAEAEPSSPEALRGDETRFVERLAHGARPAGPGARTSCTSCRTTRSARSWTPTRRSGSAPASPRARRPSRARTPTPPCSRSSRGSTPPTRRGTASASSSS